MSYSNTRIWQIYKDGHRTTRAIIREYIERYNEIPELYDVEEIQWIMIRKYTRYAIYAIVALIVLACSYGIYQSSQEIDKNYNVSVTLP